MSNDGTKAVILSSPSGGGKSTIIRHLLQQLPDYWHSVSCTTRSPRYGETDGKEYHFLSHDAFRKLMAYHELVEWAEVHGDWYGTPLAPLREQQSLGKNIVFDLDIIGTARMKERWKNILTIYLETPSRDELGRRLRKRQSETEEQIQRRLIRFDMEQEAAVKYDYRIVNDRIPATVEQVIQAIEKWQSRVKF